MGDNNVRPIIKCILKAIDELELILISYSMRVTYFYVKAIDHPQLSAKKLKWSLLGNLLF